MERMQGTAVEQTAPGISEIAEQPSERKPRLIPYLFTVQLAVALAVVSAFLLLRLAFPDRADRFLSESAALIESDVSFAPQLREAVAFVADRLAFSGDVSACAAVYTVNIGEDGAVPRYFPLSAAYSVSSPFGSRTHPITGEPDHHNGVDLAAERGTRIFAAADGTVIASGYDETAGNYVRIDHGDGWVTLYAHCDRLLAEEGMVLRAGDVIATVGTTGCSTGYHLHFAVRKDGVWLDPAVLFTALG